MPHTSHACREVQPEAELASYLFRMMDDTHADSCFGDCLFGVCADGFSSLPDPKGMGVGNDVFSWGVCGNRQEKVHDDVEASFGGKWKNGDVIGFALDMTTPGNAVMRVSVNGSFALPNGVAFNISAQCLSPAFSAASGFYRVNFGCRPFAHPPPDATAGYVSVLHYACQLMSDKAAQPAGVLGLFLYRGTGCSTERLYDGLLVSNGDDDPRMCPLTMKFNGFNAFVANVKLSGGCFYYEVEVVDGTHITSLWSKQQLSKADGTISLHTDWSRCAQLICGDYAASSELCNGRPIYYKRAGANMIIRYVYSTQGKGMWAVQLVKPSGDAWTAAELETDADITECEGSSSTWKVFDETRVSRATPHPMSVCHVKVRVWRRKPQQQHAQAAAAAVTSAVEDVCFRPAKVKSLMPIVYAPAGGNPVLDCTVAYRRTLTNRT